MTSYPFTRLTTSEVEYEMYLPHGADDHIQREIIAKGVPYEEEMLRDLVRRTAPGDLIVDVGANVGNHSVYLAAHGRRVVAIEPNAELAEAIRRSAVRNSFEDRLEVVEAGCGAVAGRGRLEVVNPSNLGMSRIETGAEGPTEIVALDALIGDRPVAALKIDVEGMEGAVLAGARRLLDRDRPIIYLEANEGRDLVEILGCMDRDDYVHARIFNVTPTHLLLPVLATESAPDAGRGLLGGIRMTPDQVANHVDLHAALRRRTGRSDPVAALAQVAAESDRTAKRMERHRALRDQHHVALAALAEARARPAKQMRRNVVSRILTWLADGPVPLPPRTAERLARSAAKRAPDRGLPATTSRPKRRRARAWSPADLDAHYARGPIAPKGLQLPSDESVTVIVPVHNGAAWLERAVHAALSQTGVVVDVVVIDDGSTDETAEIAARLARAHPEVRVVSTLRNFGCYYARNVGLLVARGTFIATLDADDIMSPDRLQRQVELIRATQGAVASQCRMRRWTADFSQPLTEPRHGENGLVWRRDAQERIGWYDSVRFGGDTEFRLRLIAAHGPEAVPRLPDEMYFLRTTESSLAMSPETAAYARTEAGGIVPDLSPSRRCYAERFAAWHRAALGGPVLPFPLMKRPFALGAQHQNAAPCLGQRRIGTMASFPMRRANLRVTLDRILPQLDELRLYLNGYDAVPDFCRHEKIRVTLGANAQGDLRDNGKFHDLPRGEDAYIFTLDDDLVYPEDYVARMVHFVEMLDRRAVVGVHGVIYPQGPLERITDRTVIRFRKASPGAFVDLLGTGTAAWHASAFAPDLSAFETAGVCDLWFATAAARAGLPMFAVPREEGWMTDQTIQGTSLFNEAVADRTGYLEVYETHLRPALRGGAVRLDAERRLASAYSEATLAAAGIALAEAGRVTGRAPDVEGAISGWIRRPDLD